MEDFETLNITINSSGYAEAIRKKFEDGKPTKNTILFLVANIYGGARILDIHCGRDLSNHATINKDEWEEIKKFADELFSEVETQ